MPIAKNLKRLPIIYPATVERPNFWSESVCFAWERMHVREGSSSGEVGHREGKEDGEGRHQHVLDGGLGTPEGIDRVAGSIVQHSRKAPATICARNNGHLQTIGPSSWHLLRNK